MGIHPAILRRRGGGSFYGVLGNEPALVADMVRDTHRNAGVRQTFDATFTTSRLGNATMVDSDGLLKWAPHNLQDYSEDLASASLSTSNVTISSNVATAPDGSTTADKLVPYNGTGVTQWVRFYRLGPSDVDSVWRIAAKADGFRYITLGYSNTGSYNAEYDLQNGVVSASPAVGNSTASITEIGDGWYWLEYAYNHAGLIMFISTYGASSGGALGGSETSIVGDGSSGVLLWGNHQYRSDLGGMAPVPVDARVAGSTTYVPTTSTAKYLPRRHNHTYNGSAWVDAGTMRETEARTNYQTSIGAGTGVTVSSGISGSPSGASDANRFSKDATEPRYGFISYNLTVSSSTAYTVSAYFKWDGHDMITSLEYNNITHFDVAWRVDFSATSSGISISLESNATGNVEDVGNGWYRCSATFTSGASATGVNPNSLVQLTGGDGASILIYGAQLEAGSTPSSYIPTNGSTVTRAADSPLTVAGADVPWPTPTVIGDELFASPTIDGGVTDTGGGAYNFSWTSGGAASLIVANVLTVGRVYAVTFTISSYVSGSLAISLQAFANGGSYNANGTFTAYVVAASGDDIRLDRSGTTGSFTVSNISVKEINPLAVCIQMEGNLTYADEDSSGTAYPFLWSGGASGDIQARLDTQSTYTGQVVFRQYDGSAVDVVSSSTTAYSPGVNVPFNIASRHGSTFVNGAVDGTALTANTTPVALPDLSSTDLAIAYDFMGNVKQVRIWVVDIGDTGLEGATS